MGGSEYSLRKMTLPRAKQRDDGSVWRSLIRTFPQIVPRYLRCHRLFDCTDFEKIQRLGRLEVVLVTRGWRIVWNVTWNANWDSSSLFSCCWSMIVLASFGKRQRSYSSWWLALWMKVYVMCLFRLYKRWMCYWLFVRGRVEDFMNVCCTKVFLWTWRFGIFLGTRMSSWSPRSWSYFFTYCLAKILTPVLNASP